MEQTRLRQESFDQQQRFVETQKPQAMSSSEESDLKSDYDEQVQQAPKEINQDMNYNEDDDLDQEPSSYSSDGIKPV